MSANNLGIIAVTGMVHCQSQVAFFIFIFLLVIFQGHDKTVEYLLSLGQWKYRAGDGMTSLHLCAITEHVKVCLDVHQYPKR